MIVRILGEGQLRVDDAVMAELQRLDDSLSAAVQAGDEPAFRAALDRLLAKVRAAGTELPPDAIEPSQAILPGPDSTMDDVRKLLADASDVGLIPG
jgi:hypothetical protein